jgi:hypothetical protein
LSGCPDEQRIIDAENLQQEFVGKLVSSDIIVERRCGQYDLFIRGRQRDAGIERGETEIVGVYGRVAERV